MHPFRKLWLEDLEENDKALFEKIKDNPTPDIADLWSISEERFIEWRKKHDFPELLKHFDKTLLLFKEWKEDNNLTNKIIINTGELTPFLERKHATKNKKLFRNKTLYLTKYYGSKRSGTFVSYQKLEGERVNLGIKFKYKFLQPFVSYLDWLQIRGKSQNILLINSRSNPNTTRERVYIHADVYTSKREFELLKMGGIKLPVNGTLLHRGKNLEFVNLCGLILEGEINFGELGNLSCSYCACDNWVANNIKFDLMNFKHCSVENFYLHGSMIKQWNFYNSQITGDFSYSKLYFVTIIGGRFYPMLQSTFLYSVNIFKAPETPDNNYHGYKTLKISYAMQGDDDMSKVYFIKEKEFVRKHIKGWKYISKTLSFYYWQYGRKPHRIVYFSLIVILLWTILYWYNKELITINVSSKNNFDFTDALYFSTGTFTTLGYGDLSPTGWLRILALVESFIGVMNMGFLVAGYTNNKY